LIAIPTEASGAVAIGWATVELERAAWELSHLLAPGSTFQDAPASLILGARCRVGQVVDDLGLRIVLLEPDSEGRLAATLARSGEGWAATWAVDPAPGTRVGAPAAGPRRARAGLSTARPGPLGDERLVLGGPLTGPHRLLVEAVPSPP
jgi:hypothetical protein